MTIHKKLYTSAFLSLSRKERLAMISKAHKECWHRDGFLNSLLLLFESRAEYLTFQFLFIYQVNNIPDPNIIIFEMTKDDRKDFYRTIGKNNCQLF